MYLCEPRASSNLYRASEIAQFDETKKLIYDTEMMTERDYQHDMYYSREEGRAEGRAEGQTEAKMEMAKNFKVLGVPIDIIAKATGLSAEEVAEL